MNYEDLNEARRSVGSFDGGTKITIEDVKKIYECARLAPSSFNLQPWKVILVHSDEMKEKLKSVALKQPKITESSAVLVILGNTRQQHESDDVWKDRVNAGLMKEEDIHNTIGMADRLYNGREYGFVSRNAGLFAMNFMLAAKDLGWDTHPMDGFDVDGVAELFELDPKFIPVMLVAIGKINPERKLAPRAFRREFEDVFDVK